MRIFVYCSLLALVCGILYALFANESAYEESAQEEPAHESYPPLPNVIILSCDTLRADHLGSYGYDRNTSPNLDELAKSATRYTKCFSTSPWTPPAHASMFTGKYPFEHGAHKWKPMENQWRPKVNLKPLSDENLTLAEVLRDEGYATGAFVANAAFLHTKWNIGQGFDTYFVKKSYAEKLNRSVLKWLDKNKESPFFLFVNYMDTHMPTNVKPLALRPEFLKGEVEQDKGKLFVKLQTKVMKEKTLAPADLVQKVINQYDRSIGNLDEQIGYLLEWLRSSGLADTTILIVTSDHGESFGEHGVVGHERDVYQQVLWVPLIIKSPGQVDGRVEESVTSLADIPHLIMSDMPSSISDKYLKTFPRSSELRPVIAEQYYVRATDFARGWSRHFNRIRVAIYRWPFKYIMSSDNQHELYDLSKDPSESNNLVTTMPELSARLGTAIDNFRQVRTFPVTPTKEDRELEMDVEFEENLRSLGYLE